MHISAISTSTSELLYHFYTNLNNEILKVFLKETGIPIKTGKTKCLKKLKKAYKKQYQDSELGRSKHLLETALWKNFTKFTVMDEFGKFYMIVT